MKIHDDVIQGSEKWLKLRSGIPTASEFNSIITPKGKPRTGEGVHTYIATKLAEWWMGGPLPSSGFWNADQGHILEAEAIPALELDLQTDIGRPGFITSDDGLTGCSPDGLIGWSPDTTRHDVCGVEVKCPEAHTHVAYLLEGTLPEQYIAQVQGSMLVTGLSQWKFFSYRRHFPALRLDIERDDVFITNLEQALGAFHELLEDGKKHLISIGGNPPWMSKTPEAEPVAETADLNEVPT